MVRNLDEELAHREKIRKQFFEDSNYRKWSDITDINDSEYGGWRDDCLFTCYLLNVRSAVYDSDKIEKIFQLLLQQNQGHYHLSFRHLN